MLIDFRVELAARLIGGPVGRELTRRSHHALSMMMQAGHRRRRLSPEELTHYCNALPSARRRCEWSSRSGCACCSGRALPLGQMYPW